MSGALLGVDVPRYAGRPGGREGGVWGAQHERGMAHEREAVRPEIGRRPRTVEQERAGAAVVEVAQRRNGRARLGHRSFEHGPVPERQRQVCIGHREDAVDARDAIAAGSGQRREGGRGLLLSVVHDVVAGRGARAVSRFEFFMLARHGVQSRRAAG